MADVEQYKEAQRLDRELDKELAPLLEKEEKARQRAADDKRALDTHRATLAAQQKAPPSYATALFAGIAIGVGLAAAVAERAA